jgi:DNA-binding NarL/FixJ family response regulator
MTRPRLLLADDHRMLRDAFAQILESHYEVVGQAANGRDLLDLAKELSPQVIVLDIGMPLLNGLDAARQLKKILPEAKLIFLTVSEDPDLAVEAFRVGASGFLLKNSAASELLQAIEEALGGRSYITPLSAKGLMEACLHPREGAQDKDKISPRQREVLQLLVEGHTMKEIARILKIKPRTVAFHKYALMKDLGITSSAELVQYGVKHGLVSQ